MTTHKENKAALKNHLEDKTSWETSLLPVSILSKMNHVHYLAFRTFTQVR